MPTNTLIDELRRWAEVYQGEEQGALMALAADRLEELDERADIVAVERQAEAAAPERVEALPGAVIHISRGGEIRIEVGGK